MSVFNLRIVDTVRSDVSADHMEITLLSLKRRAGKLGLFKTMLELDKVIDACAEELAERELSVTVKVK